METKRIPLPLFFSKMDESVLPSIIGGRLVNVYIENVAENPVIKKAPGLEKLRNLGYNYPVDVFWWDTQNIAIAVCFGRIFKITTRDGNLTDITGDALSVIGKTTFDHNGYGFMSASGGRIATYHLYGRPLTAPGLTLAAQKDRLKIDAFTFSIANTSYSKTGTDNISPGTDTIPQNKYGAVALDIDSAGTITPVSAAANATGYDSAVLAVAGLPACATTKCRIGWVTAMNTAAAFVFDTTEFDVATVTEAYTDNTLWSADTTVFLGDADAPTQVSHVAYIGGYFIANKLNTGHFHHSNFGAPLDWLSTSWFNAETKPDIIKALHVHDREISMFGENSIEVWVPAETGSVFQRLDGAYVERGTIASNSIKHQLGVYLWLDDERHIVKMSGRAPTILSGPIDDEIMGIYPAGDCSSLGFSMGKQIFTIFTFHTEDRSFVYNHTSDSWTEWGEWDSENIRFKKWPGYSACYCKAWDMVLVGGYNGEIYKVRPDDFQNDGDTIRTIMRTGVISHGNYDEKRSNEIRIRCKRGAGGVAGDEPKFTFRYRNQDNVWRIAEERQVSLGKIGDSEMIKRIHRLGVYRTRQYEIEHTSNCDFMISVIEEDIN